MALAGNDFLFDIPDVRGLDFAAHNAESKSLWEAFRNRTHERVPVQLGCNPRILMLDPDYNRRGITYEDYMQDPDLMAQAHLEFQYWCRFVLPGDQEKGLPESWTVSIDFENHYDAAWFGCPVHYRASEVPDTTPILRDDNKRMLFDRGIPEPFAGEWPERCLRVLEHFEKKSKAGWTFLGAPVKPPTWTPFMGFDGVFTGAASLRGPTALCTDLLEDPEYAHELLDYISTASLSRMKAWRDRLGSAYPQDDYAAADDSIELISTDLYREFVLPLHRRQYDTFGANSGRGIHLCGRAQRHFVTIRDELGVTTFDTGFPIDFAAFRRDLGPDVWFSGGPAVSFFLEDEPGPVVAETERICRSGILEGGRVSLREGNNLPPRARLHVCQAFYDAAKRFGRLVALSD